MAEIVALSGQPFREVWDGMTWPDYLALNRFWQQWPPATVSLAVLAHLAPQQREGNPDGAPAGALQGQDAVEYLSQFLGPPPTG